MSGAVPFFIHDGMTGFDSKVDIHSKDFRNVSAIGTQSVLLPALVVRYNFPLYSL